MLSAHLDKCQCNNRIISAAFPKHKFMHTTSREILYLLAPQVEIDHELLFSVIIHHYRASCLHWQFENPFSLRAEKTKDSSKHEIGIN